MLEILTGYRCLDKNRPSGQQNLSEWARPYLIDKKRTLKIIDPRLDGHFSVKGAQKAGNLARRCLSRDPKLRPSMTEVVEILEQLQNLKDLANPTSASQGVKPSPLMNGRPSYHRNSL